MERIHIVWDWNGTLLDDLDVVIESLNKGIGTLGHPPIDADRYRDHFTRPVRSFYDSLLGRPISDREWSHLDAIFHEEYFMRVGSAPLAVDATDALDMAALLGCSQSLLSMSTHDRLVEVVASRGIAGRFAAIDGLTTATGGLKAPHLRRHLELLGVAPGRAVLIGDTPDDAHAAAAVGARVIAYDGGSHHRSTLDSLGVPVAPNLVEAVGIAVEMAASAALR